LHITLAVSLVAAYLIGHARGKRLADPDHCRRCTYPLLGVPPAAESPKWCICLECGQTNRMPPRESPESD
jgi:hypothetical protein